MEKETFYSAYGDWQDTLVEGAMLKFEHKVEYEKFRIDIPEITEISTLSLAELKQRRKDSAKLEQDIFSRIKDVIKEWEAQAGQTLLLDKALEYANTPQVAHTSNKWKQLEDGSWEISNLVYKMCYKIWEDAAGDKKGTWLVTWVVGMNLPKRPPTEKYSFNGEFIIAEQKKKRYDTFDAAQRYIQGRFDLYVHHFSELRPPIPEKYKKHFYTNGCLLPKYTVAPPEQTGPDLKVVDALLGYLEEGDGEMAQPPAPPSAPAVQSIPAPPKPSAPQSGKPKRPSPKPKPKRKNTLTR